MDIDGAVRAWERVGDELADAQKLLGGLADLEWTGRAAEHCAEAIEVEARCLLRLRTIADDAAVAIRRHAAEVRAVGGTYQ